MNYGFRAVISSRFADIFRGNSGKQGLLTAVCSQDDVELLWKYLENNPGASVTVDLESRTVTAGDIVARLSLLGGEARNLGFDAAHDGGKRVRNVDDAHRISHG